jgi:hypothetical protein
MSPVAVAESDRTAFWQGWISRREIIVDLAAFGVTVSLAATLHWRARDLIWGLWISSLCVGYTHIVMTIVAGVRPASGAPTLSAVVGGLGLLAFFTFHFGVFHLVHSMFLNLFFPLVGRGIANPIEIFQTTLARYWPFVLVNLGYRWRDLPKGRVSLAGKDAFMAPYASVIRMHLLIFVFAGLHALHLGHLAIYPVLAAYFFPWHQLPRSRKSRASDRES